MWPSSFPSGEKGIFLSNSDSDGHIKMKTKFHVDDSLKPDSEKKCRIILISSLFPSTTAAAAAAAAKSLQSFLTLCDPIDGGPPGFPVPGILQTRTLEWVAISFSNAGKPFSIQLQSYGLKVFSYRVRKCANTWGPKPTLA